MWLRQPSLRRALRDMVSGLQHMKLNNGGRDKPPQLCPLTESPLTPSKSAASYSDLGSCSAAASPGSHLGSLGGHHAVRRSPLSRNVVTALEAELDQARFTPQTLNSIL